MKSRHLIALSLAAFTAAAVAADAAENEAPVRQLAVFSKNLARQHLGANLFTFNADNQTYVPTEASAAWLDDDVTTGWPPQAGKQYYLLALPEAQLMTNFEVSTRGGEGKINLYAADEPAAPGSSAWTPLAKDVSLTSVNQKELAQPFNRFAKYLLIETDLPDAAPWYSLYVFGERPAVDYTLAKRSSPIDTDAIFGPYVNNQTAFSYSSLYAKGRVTYAQGETSELVLQRAIDDNPETVLQVAPSAKDASLVVKYNEPRSVQRISTLVQPGTKGTLDLFLINSAATGEPVSLEGMTPTVSMVFDGTNPRSSLDFPAVTANTLAARWTPADGSQPLALSEINSFGDTEISGYAVNAASSPAIAAQGDTETAGVDEADAYVYEYTGDGKEYVDYKDSKKTVLPPVAEFLPTKSPFVPGTLGFPPNLPPNTPVSE